MSILQNNLWRLLAVVCLLHSSLRSEEYSLSLCEAERMALVRNQLVRIAGEGVTESQWSQRIALGAWMPQIGYKAGVNESEHAPVPFLPYDTFYTNQFSLDQLLFSSDEFFDVRLSGVELKRRCIELAKRQNDLILEIRRRYYRVVLDEENVESARQNLHTLLQSLKQEQEGYEIGTGTRLDVVQAEASYYQGVTAYYESVNALKASQNDFMQTLGVSPDCATTYAVAEKRLPVMETGDLGERVVEADAYSQREQEEYMARGVMPHTWSRGEIPGLHTLLPPREIACWTGLAMQYRPEIKRSEIDLEGAGIEINKGYGRYLPTLGFFAQYQANPPDGFAFQFDRNMWWNGGFALSWSLFDGFRRASGINRAKAHKRAVCLEYERQIIATDTQVLNLLIDLVSASFAYAASERRVEASVLNVELSAKSREIGLMTTLDYLITISDLFEARKRRNRAAFALLDAYYSLRHAVGIDTPMWYCCR